jgi:hypothetical protein
MTETAPVADPRMVALDPALLHKELHETIAERDGLARLMRRYESITTAWTRGMYSARIDCWRGDVKAAISCLSEGLDGYDGTEWNGTETGTEWWERTKAEEEPASVRPDIAAAAQELTPVEAVRLAVAEDWQPLVDAAVERAEKAERALAAQPQPAAELVRAMGAVAAYEDYAQRMTVPDATARRALRERHGLE